MVTPRDTLFVDISNSNKYTVQENQEYEVKYHTSDKGTEARLSYRDKMTLTDNSEVNNQKNYPTLSNKYIQTDIRLYQEPEVKIVPKINKTTDLRTNFIKAKTNN